MLIIKDPHFKCALGEATKVITVSGAGSIDTAKASKKNGTTNSCIL